MIRFTNLRISLETGAGQEKSNEIKDVPLLVGKLDMIGKILTADAMSTQKDIIDCIRKKGGGFLIELKAHQRALFYGVEDGLRKKTSLHSYTDGPELGHGRIETILQNVPQKPVNYSNLLYFSSSILFFTSFVQGYQCEFVAFEPRVAFSQAAQFTVSSLCRIHLVGDLDKLQNLGFVHQHEIYLITILVVEYVHVLFLVPTQQLDIHDVFHTVAQILRCKRTLAVGLEGHIDDVRVPDAKSRHGK